MPRETAAAPVYPLAVRRRLNVLPDLYAAIHEAVAGSSARAGTGKPRPLDRTSVTLLARNTINVAAGYSHNFNGMQPAELQARLQEALPPSAAGDLMYPLWDIRFLQTKGASHLVMLPGHPSEIRKERKQLDEKLRLLSHVAITGSHLPPFIVLAEYPAGVELQEAVRAAKEVAEPYVRLYPAEIVDTSKQN